jgi:cysteinyl-tRNA synthetase
MHSELVLAGGKKMSRSGGNAVTLQDVLNLRYTAREVRHLLCSTHYRQPVLYSEENLKANRAALRRIDIFVGKLRRCSAGKRSDSIQNIVEEMVASFEAAMRADLNVPMALGALFLMIRKVNRLLAREGVSKEDALHILDALENINSVLAFLDLNPAGFEPEDPEIEAMVDLREEARERKDYGEADRIREDLRKKNVVLEDTACGTLYWMDK